VEWFYYKEKQIYRVAQKMYTHCTLILMTKECIHFFVPLCISDINLRIEIFRVFKKQTPNIWEYEEVLLTVKERRNILHEISKRKANWIGHILCRNCLLQQVIEGKIKFSFCFRMVPRLIWKSVSVLNSFFIF
jgi:hypothetical protein